MRIDEMDEAEVAIQKNSDGSVPAEVEIVHTVKPKSVTIADMYASTDRIQEAREWRVGTYCNQHDGHIGAHIYGGNMLSVSHDEAEVLIAGGASIVPTLAVMAGFTRIIRLGDTWYAEREEA